LHSEVFHGQRVYTYTEDLRYSYENLVENLKEEDHLEDLSTDGSLSQWVFKYIGWKNVDWIHLAENRYEGQSLF
jgi:hypothetical protein